jgi:hypothetical protein
VGDGCVQRGVDPLEVVDESRVVVGSTPIPIAAAPGPTSRLKISTTQISPESSGRSSNPIIHRARSRELHCGR